MYKKINYITTILLLITVLTVKAQVTTQSPYSKFGIGNIKGTMLPQFRGMGGLSTAIYKPSFYSSNINMQNPASYAGINITVLDMGATGGITKIQKANQSENSFNGTLGHIAMAFPTTRRSAVSFGLVPYTELGYEFKNSTKIDTMAVDYLYAGEGGLAKAYLGYGYQLGDNLRIGANIEYLFGNLKESKSTEFPKENSAINSKIQNKNKVGGINLTYGMQYDIIFDLKTKLTFGYSGTSAANISSSRTLVVTDYKKDALGNERAAIDTLLFTENTPNNLKLPFLHNFGVVFQKTDKWLIGADFRMGNWSKLIVNSVNEGLQNTVGVSVGGQITPDFTSIGSYFKRVDYRLGFMYDKTYVKLNSQNIKQTAVTFGLGLPLASNRQSFYKINFATELGKRGTLTNGLVQESYVNFRLGFVLNDKWFDRFKFN